MPSSVALSRDNMSDLSGVSGERGASSQQVPGQILDPKSLLRPWNQAYIVSNTPPENSAEQTRNSDSSKTPSIWVADNDVVEIFDNLEASLGLDRFQIRKHDRIPIMVLLMDPSQQTYELMQIWVDRSIDSIRDLVQVLQHKLPAQWKQAYDGLFQVRGNRFTQLINIIKLVKYDIQPNEILIAKPWSMAAKVTIAIAGSAIRHLTRIGVIASDHDEGKGRSRYRRQQRNEDAPLLLSKTAQDRAYFPEGILDHHHAMQFITFSPPFESEGSHSDASEQLSGLSPLHNNNNNAIDESRWDAHASLLGSNNSNSNNGNNRCGKFSPGMITKGVRRVIGGPRSRRGKTTQTTSRIVRTSKTSSIEEEEEIQFLVGSSELETTSEPISRQQQQQQQPEYYSTTETTTRVGCFSGFSCLRNSVRDVQETTEPKPNTTMSEDDEKRWLAYSMKPIDEDQSLANASVVSMSAPLLSPSRLE